jgi:CheY-like chemotaxis protein
MDGLQLCRQVREAVALPPKLVLMSSLARADIRAEAAALGVAAVLQKPLRPATFLQAIEEILAGTPRGSGLTAPPMESLRPELLGTELPYKILVADDNPVNQLVARRMLERCGYKIDLASNGEEAFAAVEQGAHDVVFMDVQMPVMNGFEATGRIRERLPADRQPWIIALTANALEGDRETCLQNGMNDYLPKPIRLAELERALRAVKRKA